MCPNCFAERKVGFHFCPNCGTMFAWRTRTEFPEEKTCHCCGAVNPATANYCKRCAANLRQETYFNLVELPDEEEDHFLQQNLVAAEPLFICQSLSEISFAEYFNLARRWLVIEHTAASDECGNGQYLLTIIRWFKLEMMPEGKVLFIPEPLPQPITTWVYYRQSK